MEIKKQNGCTKEEKIKEQKEPKARCLERKSKRVQKLYLLVNQF